MERTIAIGPVTSAERGPRPSACGSGRRHRLDPVHDEGDDRGRRVRGGGCTPLAEALLAELAPEGVVEDLLVSEILLAADCLRSDGDHPRAERSLHRALRTLSSLRRGRPPVIAEPARETPRLGCEASADSVLWRDRLTFDPTVSHDSPVVRGTWITVGQVITRIVDGWTWGDILRAHPELCEDDIRACLAFAVEDEESR